MNSECILLMGDLRQTPIEKLDQSTAFATWDLYDGTKWLEIFRVQGGYVLRFPEFANFQVSDDGLHVSVLPHQGVSAQTVEHLYLNQVLPLALSRQWQLVLHGSAVEIDNVAVAFLGKSGRGKSTLAASFSINGFRFLTDDGLQLDRSGSNYVVKPSHPSIRLWDDSRKELIPETTPVSPPVDYTPKARMLADDQMAFCHTPRRLACAYFLGTGETDQIIIEPIRPRDAMLGLVGNSFLLDIEEHEMLTHHFSQLSSLAVAPIFFRLDYPRRYEMLPEVRQAVVQHTQARFSISSEAELGGE